MFYCSTVDAVLFFAQIKIYELLTILTINTRYLRNGLDASCDNLYELDWVSKNGPM